MILGIESSAVSASAAVMRDGKLLADFYLNVGLTHSVTLMPLIAEAVKGAGLTAADIDAVAVTAGPGSFTGVRIGIATAKGIAEPRGVPCVPVSTLEAIAYPAASAGATVAACMDARRSQVYFGLFRGENGRVARLHDDCPISLEELAPLLRDTGGEIILAGDGADVAYDYLKDRVPGVGKASPATRYQSAASVCCIAHERLSSGGGVPPAELVPVYLRQAQAERVRAEKEAECPR